MTYALIVWIIACVAFLTGWIVCAIMTRNHWQSPPIDTEEQRDADRYMPPLVGGGLDYKQRVLCPNTGIDTRYCTCLTCGAAHPKQRAIKGTAA